ncbi:MAG: hypothetical protein JWR16_50 [Nevskia sp.]|nr:hypothetical protein [Nevskia sp.]
MRVTYYDEFTRLTRLKAPYAWAIRLAVAGSLLLLIAKMVEAGLQG